MKEILTCRRFAFALRKGIRNIPRYYSTNINSESVSEELTKNDQQVIPSLEQLTEPKKFKLDSSISLVRYLKSRYLIENITHEELFQLTEVGASKKLSLYCGADPTARSLHLGNLIPLMILLHFNLQGHEIFGLVGGATGAVGDPSGRATERTLLENAERELNVESIQYQMKRFMLNGVEYAKSRQFPFKKNGKMNFVNNKTWWESVKLLDFLSVYGSHIRISSMLGRDSIQSRLQSTQGLGFNEFTYQILQAFDFWHLFKEHGVDLQIGGNDQWGNITAGTELISRLSKKVKTQKECAYGITVPLLTTSSGEKFGKSSGNAVFISPEITSPFQLYQYFVNVPDDIVGKLLKIFTLLPLESIEEVLINHSNDASLRVAQRVLAREVTDLIHGVGTGEEMAFVSTFLFPNPETPFDDKLKADQLIQMFRHSGLLKKIDLEEFQDPSDLKMSSLLAKIMNKSKTETKNLIKAGGVYLGLERDQFIDPDDVVLFDKDSHLIDNKLMLIRTGKQNYILADFS